MTTPANPEGDPALRHVLRQWRVDASLPPRFQEQVWQRIARSETQPGTSLWAVLSRWVEVTLPRPKLALAYVSLILAIGVAAGSFAAQSATRRFNAELGHRYVASLDPYYADAANTAP
jgi:hypothetical protein